MADVCYCIDDVTLNLMTSPCVDDVTHVPVLVINHSNSAVDVSVTLASVGITAASAKARDVWAHTDLGSVSGTWNIKALATHDSAFAVFSV